MKHDTDNYMLLTVRHEFFANNLLVAAEDANLAA